MKNEEKNFDLEISDIEENLKIDKIFQSKQPINNNDLILNEFDADLSISDIVNNDKNDFKSDKNTKNNNPFENNSIDKDFSVDLDKINLANENINESLIHKNSMDNIQLDFNSQNDNNIKDNNEENKKEKKVRTKDDLNNTPLPIFECLYCTNEKVVFGHFINEILSDKYLLQTSKYDMNDLDKLIFNRRLINKDDKNEKLLNVIIKSTEYIKFYVPKDKSLLYFKSDIFNILCQKNENDNHVIFKQKIEDSIVRKKKDFYFRGIKNIPKNSMNNKLFNSTNSLINNFNALSGLVEPVKEINTNNNNIKNNFTIATCSNNSINFNSLSLNNNEFNCYCKDNNNMLDYIVEKIEKNDESVNYADDKDEIIDIFKIDLEPKSTKKDIKWEERYYDIWNPEIDSDFDENDYNENDYNVNTINEENKNKSISISNNLIKNKNINKSMGFIRHNISKNNNLIFTFNKNKEKSIKNKFNNDLSKYKISNINNINNISNNKSINSNKYSIKSNIRNLSKENENKNLQKESKKSVLNMCVNKSHDPKKYSNKLVNNYYNNNHQNNNYNYNKKYNMGISYLKSFGSTTNSSYNINKSANFLGKSRQKINFNKKEKNNTKSLHYMSSNKNNNNSSMNYSIGVSINLKSNCSVKSNGIINCWNPNKISQFSIDNSDNKIINKYNNKKKTNNSLNKKNKIFNIFNNINIINLTHSRAKSNYNLNSKLEKDMKKTSKSKNKYKNKNKKNNYSIYKKSSTNKKISNFSSGKQKTSKVISRTNDLLYSSSSIFNNNHKDSLYTKSIGLSFGSNDNNLSENNTNVVFNSISNINKSNSNINSSYYNYSPSKFNKTYYYNKNNKELQNKINDLISSINSKPHNKNEIYYFNKNSSSNNKNKSINCFNSISYMDKLRHKKNNNLYSNKSNYS